MMGKNDDAAYTHEDSFLTELIPQVTEHLAAQHARDFDAEAGRARFLTWLAAHTKEPAAPAKGRAGASYVRQVIQVGATHRLRRISLAFCGILSVAAMVLVAAFISPVIVIFLAATLLGVLAGGALCAHHLRAGIAPDISPRLERMQNQLDLIESAVDIALAKWYDELRHYPPRPPEFPASDRDDADWS